MFPSGDNLTHPGHTGSHPRNIRQKIPRGFVRDRGHTVILEAHPPPLHNLSKQVEQGGRVADES